ncbi:MAG: YcnI family protein [Acidimicrobiia bacterium]
MPIARRLVPVAVALLTAVAAAVPAAAHVTVNPREVPKGSFAKLAFRMPNERPDSGSVKLEVTFPPEHPFRSVSVRPQPGWAFTVEKTALATPIEREGREPVTEVVSKITWTGGPVNPDEFEEFEVSAGPMPEDADELVFKAVQTYASGEVVRWIEEATPGGEEPEHPAPVLRLTGDGGSHGGAGASGGEEERGEVAAAGAGVASDDDVDGARRLAVVALVLGALGLLAGIGGLARQRSGGAPAPGDAGPGATS